ncbi:MAG: ABC transporter permease [Chthoniobacterales bacterium]|nr:ABC transporter permease [Chthoniobacterales bacterium]
MTQDFLKHWASILFFKRFPLAQAFYLYLGQTALLVMESLHSIVKGRVRWTLVLGQLVDIGYGSQFVVIVTGAFTGAVFTAQIFYQFSTLNMSSAVGPVVCVALFRELGPVLTGLMVAGRVGAAMSAEIGTMKVTQQLDALRALAVHPIDYLVVPRVVAMIISMPLLVAECVFFGILSAYFVATQLLAIPSVYFLQNIQRFIDGHNLVMSLVKGFVFAIIIVFISCQQGLTTREGAVGVGKATTEAVVLCSLCILIGNFFLTMVLNMVFPAGLR